MMARWLPVATLAVAVALAMLTQAGTAVARTMHVMESRPAASAVMQGREEEFFIRFDGPVNHAASALAVRRDGRLVAALRPRLESQPNTLYAAAGGLAAGAYVLHWRAISAPDGEATEGDIGFSVR